MASLSFEYKSGIGADLRAYQILTSFFKEKIMQTKAIDNNAMQLFKDRIENAIKTPDYPYQKREYDEIRAFLPPIHEIVTSNKEKRAYYLNLQKWAKLEHTRWQINAFIIALISSSFLIGIVCLNTACIVFLSKMLLPLPLFGCFQILLFLNFTAVKLIRKTGFLEKNIIYEHVTFYRQIALILEEKSLKHYDPAFDLDPLIQKLLRFLVLKIKEAFYLENIITGILKIIQSIIPYKINYKLLLAKSLAFLLTDPETAPLIKYFFNYSSVRVILKIFIKRIILEEHEKKLLLEIQHCFARQMGIDEEAINQAVEAQNWDVFFNLVFA